MKSNADHWFDSTFLVLNEYYQIDLRRILSPDTAELLHTLSDFYMYDDVALFLHLLALTSHYLNSTSLIYADNQLKHKLNLHLLLIVRAGKTSGSSFHFLSEYLLIRLRSIVSGRTHQTIDDQRSMSSANRSTERSSTSVSFESLLPAGRSFALGQFVLHFGSFRRTWHGPTSATSTVLDNHRHEQRTVRSSTLGNEVSSENESFRLANRLVDDFLGE